MNPIHEFAVAYGQAFRSGEVDQVMSLMTDDVIALTPDKPTLVGSKAVREQIAADLAMMDVQDLQFTHEEVVVAGDWAYAWGRTHGTVIESGSSLDIAGKYLWILQRQSDGKWKLSHDSSHGD